MEDYLPPGFRFYPTEEELVSFYLHNKLEGRNDRLNRIMDRVIPVLDIYEFNPWDLPQFSGNLCYGDPEQWFFFVPKQESEARGGRPKRLTTLGYWKATGCPGHVYSSDDRKIGHKRTMVFYNGRAPNGRKTDWKMNEYKLAMESEGGASSSNGAPPTPAVREEFSLCRVYKKSKCVRAYDRRPIGVGISGTRNQQMRGDETRSTTHESPDPTAERTVLTPDTENSSTGDHQDQNLPQTGGSTTGTAMTQDTDPFWEWEQLLTDFDFDNEDMKPN